MPRLPVKFIVAGGLIAGGVYLASQKKISIPFAQQLQQSGSNVQGTVQELSENVGGQAKVLGERSQEVASHVQKVLGEAVTANPDKESSDSSKSGKSALTSIPEKTLEYSQYLYCRQVIKDYEANH